MKNRDTELSRLRRYPLINDVTTTPTAPPRFRQLSAIRANFSRDMDYPQQFKEIQEKYYSDLEPIKLPVDLERAFQKAKELAKKMKGWHVIHADSQQKVIEAVATTPWVKFKDDVVLEIRPGENEWESVVHMRSKSRLGRGDFGANYKRIRQFLSLLGTK